MYVCMDVILTDFQYIHICKVVWCMYFCMYVCMYHSSFIGFHLFQISTYGTVKISSELAQYFFIRTAACKYNGLTYWYKLRVFESRERVRRAWSFIDWRCLSLRLEFDHHAYCGHIHTSGLIFQPLAKHCYRKNRLDFYL